MPATSQLDKLISITAISVLSCFKTIRDWFRSFGFCIGGLHRVTSATMCAISSPPPHSISDQSALAAEDCFNQAAQMAREQGALFWELRVALSVARLRVSQGRHHEARAPLASV